VADDRVGFVPRPLVMAGQPASQPARRLCRTVEQAKIHRQAETCRCISKFSVRERRTAVVGGGSRKASWVVQRGGGVPECHAALCY